MVGVVALAFVVGLFGAVGRLVFEVFLEGVGGVAVEDVPHESALGGLAIHAVFVKLISILILNNQPTSYQPITLICWFSLVISSVMCAVW